MSDRSQNDFQQLGEWSDISSAVITCDLAMPDESAPRLSARSPLVRFIVGCLLAWLLVAGVHLLYQTSLMVSSIVHSSHPRHEWPQRQPYRSARNR